MFRHLLLVGIVAGVGGGCAEYFAQQKAEWKKDHCNYDGAYADGMNDGRKGRDMQLADFAECPAEVEADVMQGYREGYTAGAASQPAAPVTVQVNGGGGPTAVAPASGQWPCQSTLDCHGKGWCKDRGDGVELCMDKGPRGAYCTSTIDCASGFWCKDGPGGLKICM